MLPCLNGDLDGDEINIQNIVRKFCKLKEKIRKLPEVAATILACEVLVKPSEEWKVLGKWLKLEELNGGNIIELDEDRAITIGMFHELGRYKLKTRNITWSTIGKWLAKKFRMDEDPTPQYLSFDFKRIH